MKTHSFYRLARILRAFAGFALGSLLSLPVTSHAADLAPESTVNPAIPAYQPRFGRTRPVIAVVGENSGTELTDFVIPYGVLVRSGAAEVITVSTKPGPVRMRPVMAIQPDQSIAQFDARFPEGADYVIVPAVVNFRDPALVAWVKSQGLKGGTLVSICDGAVVIAGTGLMDGHRATAHWASEKSRRKLFPAVQWVDDIRYLSDARIVSTAGISAAIPTSLALVQAIAGTARAEALAAEMGVADWSPRHTTAPFRPRFGVNLKALIAVNYTNAWFHSTDMIGLPISNDVDEITLAATADAYSRTGRSMVHVVSATETSVRTRSGLVVIPDRVPAGHRLDRMLPEIVSGPSGLALTDAINGVCRLYGRNTAYGVALDFEYPMTFPSERSSTRKAASR